MFFPFVFLFIGFTFGQIASVVFGNGIRVSLLDISIIFFLTVAAFQKRFSSRAIKKYVYFFGPFLAVGLLSLLVNSFKLTTIQFSISLLFFIRFFVYSLLIISVTQKNKHLVLEGLFLAGVTVAILGLLQYFLYPNLRNLSYLGWDPHEFRLFSTLLDPNFTGIILVATFWLGVYLLLIKKIQKVAWSLLLCIIIGALLLTYSRGAYVAFTASTLGAIVILKQWKWLLLFPIGLLFLVLLPRPSGEGVNLLRTISTQARLDNATVGWQLFLKSPVIGQGFDAVRFIRTDLVINESGSLSNASNGFQNSYVFILVTTGIVGLFGYFLLWKRLFSKSIQSFKKKELQSTKLLLVTSLVAVGTHSLFDNSLFYPYVMVWLWLLFGTFVTDYI
jgi:O-antigen ligase